MEISSVSNSSSSFNFVSELLNYFEEKLLETTLRDAKIKCFLNMPKFMQIKHKLIIFFTLGWSERKKELWEMFVVEV